MNKRYLGALVLLGAVLLGILLLSGGSQDRAVPPYFRLAETPALIRAAALGEVSTLKSLLAGGADLEQQDAFGSTALHAAVLTHRDELVEFLLDRGARLESRDRDGRTPLYIAVELEQASLVGQLLEAGADPFATNFLGVNPLSLTAATGADEVFETLAVGQDLGLVADSAGNRLLHTASLWGQEEIVKRLLLKGVELDATNHSGQTPLMLAAENRHAFLVRLLLERGASLERLDLTGKTVLHWGVIGGHPAVVGILLEAGVEDRADLEGLSAEDYARRRPLVMIEEIFASHQSRF